MQTAIAPAIGTYWQWREHSIYYVKAGDRTDRPPLLLIHGFGASTDHWRKNVAGLQQDFEVWAIDLLGFGRSEKATVEYSGDLWREQLHDFITQVIGRPAVLAGNSIGGYASLLVAAKHPESVVGVVLLNCAGGFSDAQMAEENSGAEGLRGAIAKAIFSFVLQPIPNFFVFQYFRQKSVIRQTLQKVYLDQSAVTDQLVEDIYRPTCDPGAAQVFNAIFKSPKGESNDALLSQMSCPLLVLWGEGDPWIRARERGAKFRQFYPTLTDHYLQAGHCPHDEIPDQVNSLMRDWVLQIASKSSN